jgi:prefoldin subunit 5
MKTLTLELDEYLSLIDRNKELEKIKEDLNKAIEGGNSIIKTVYRTQNSFTFFDSRIVYYIGDEAMEALFNKNETLEEIISENKLEIEKLKEKIRDIESSKKTICNIFNNK